MRRILLALLICLLPLQSFAGSVMNTKMASMRVAMTATTTIEATQVACHMASQTDSAASHDCCCLQGVCQALCHIAMAPVTFSIVLTAPASADSPGGYAIAFQSADARLGFKPPLL